MRMSLSINFNVPDVTGEIKASNVLLERIAVALEKIAADPPVRAEIVLGVPSLKGNHMSKVQLNFKKGTKRAGPDLSFPQLASDGAQLSVFDAAGNVTTFNSSTTTVAWSSSDPTVIAITVNPADQTQATAKSTGKAGTGITLTATFTNLDGSAPMPPAVSQGIDVPAGPAASASIVLGVPA